MATLSSILAWKIPGAEEPGRLQSIGSQGVGHDRATKPPHGEDKRHENSVSTIICLVLYLTTVFT